MSEAKMMVALHEANERLTEVGGQFAENGSGHHLFKDAVRQLAEAVDMLVELAEV